MGASRVDCTACGRKPGTPHLPDCRQGRRFQGLKIATKAIRARKRLGISEFDRRVVIARRKQIALEKEEGARRGFLITVLTWGVW